MKIFVVIPAYNESKVLFDVLKEVQQFQKQIVVVDDGSKDNTASEALRAGVTVLQHPINCGQGAALQTGITYALQEGADIVVTFDADGQFVASEIGSVFTPILEGRADFVKGSRFLGKKANIEWLRLLCLKMAISFTRLTTGLKLTDVHNGFMAISRETALKLDIKQARMAHQSEITHFIADEHIRFTEVPVTVRYTEYSRTKGQKFSDYFKILKDLFLSHFTH